MNKIRMKMGMLDTFKYTPWNLEAQLANSILFILFDDEVQVTIDEHQNELLVMLGSIPFTLSNKRKTIKRPKLQCILKIEKSWSSFSHFYSMLLTLMLFSYSKSMKSCPNLCFRLQLRKFHQSLLFYFKHCDTTHDNKLYINFFHLSQRYCSIQVSQSIRLLVFFSRNTFQR